MNIDKFKRQHIEIIEHITALRNFSKEGISENAAEIAALIIAMSSIIKLHLAVEDQLLYPALQRGKNSALAKMGKRFQDEMATIASAYMDFARKWNHASNVSRDPEGFRLEANKVLKILHDRMHKENTDFYPIIETL
ncbi:MAG TPA: hemerythrin domain-containing protein [Thiobacillus sp.]|nr:hemerythrin domain-containing protein [Thiobacillus sp.]